MNNTTHSVKANEIEKKWYILDAADRPLGRVATEAARLLKGKHKPTYSTQEAARLLKGKHKPTYSTHIDCGDNVIVINSDKAVLTGNKLENKKYRRHSSYMTGLKEVSYKDLMATNSDKAVMLAVKGMLPHNTLGREMLKKLRVCKGAEHNHEAQKPEQKCGIFRRN